jgi:hypothetical protein
VYAKAADVFLLGEARLLNEFSGLKDIYTPGQSKVSCAGRAISKLEKKK